ncbi:ATP-binding cassette domain-containing protein, partial [Streptosporangium sp. NPDC001682]
MTTPLISALHVRKSFGQHTVLHDVSLDVHQGEAVCLLGRSGSGKSTFLRCLNLLERTDSGVVMLDGELLGYEERGGKIHRLSAKREARQRQRLGMVFQQFNLFSHKTVLENVVEAPIRVLRRPADEARRDAHELLDRVGLAEKADAYPAQLSGGQQDRARAAQSIGEKEEAERCFQFLKDSSAEAS